VLDKQTPLVVVLLTSREKSLLFTLPAYIEEADVTIVVVPYWALINNLVSRIYKYSVDCMEWKHGESNPASIAIISVDVASDSTSNSNLLEYA
jgi:superfamily II DNA helicase RecQ